MRPAYRLFTLSLQQDHLVIDSPAVQIQLEVKPLRKSFPPLFYGTRTSTASEATLSLRLEEASTAVTV